MDVLVVLAAVQMVSSCVGLVETNFNDVGAASYPVCVVSSCVSVIGTVTYLVGLIRMFFI